VKEYPITESEMHELKSLGMIATVCFSLASGIAGFLIDLQKDLSLSQGAPEKAVSFWTGVWWASAFAAVSFAAAGGWAIYKGSSRVEEIKNETEHD
jgi:hypothetical protein